MPEGYCRTAQQCSLILNLILNVMPKGKEIERQKASFKMEGI